MHFCLPSNLVKCVHVFPIMPCFYTVSEPVTDYIGCKKHITLYQRAVNYCFCKSNKCNGGSPVIHSPLVITFSFLLVKVLTTYYRLWKLFGHCLGCAIPLKHIIICFIPIYISFSISTYQHVCCRYLQIVCYLLHSYFLWGCKFEINFA